jgi:hypothetical protein
MSTTALKNKEAPLMSADDPNVLAEPLPANVCQNPARLELWLKLVAKDAVNSSKTDAAASTVTCQPKIQHSRPSHHTKHTPAQTKEMDP